MIYEFIITETDEKQYVSIPDELNQTMSIKVAEYSPVYENSKFATCLGAISEESIPEGEVVTAYAEFIHPSLFFQTDDEDNSLKINEEVFEIASKKFINAMMYHWSKVNNHSLQDYLDNLENNDIEALINKVTMKNIIE